MLDLHNSNSKPLPEIANCLETSTLLVVVVVVPETAGVTEGIDGMTSPEVEVAFPK